jgi:hypothetical protein
MFDYSQIVSGLILSAKSVFVELSAFSYSSGYFVFYFLVYLFF